MPGQVRDTYGDEIGYIFWCVDVEIKRVGTFYFTKVKCLTKFVIMDGE